LQESKNITNKEVKLKSIMKAMRNFKRKMKIFPILDEKLFSEFVNSTLKLKFLKMIKVIEFKTETILRTNRNYVRY